MLYIEAVELPGGRDLTLTGQLGEVMREVGPRGAELHLVAGDAAGHCRKRRCARSGVHIHVPAGAIPKDGPSAGVAMATALASMYTEQPARSDTAMTGEITLTGLVLPIGGVKEKVLAARRAGIRRVILPEQNAKDLRDLPDEVRQRDGVHPRQADRRRAGRGHSRARAAPGGRRSAAPRPLPTATAARAASPFASTADRSTGQTTSFVCH